MPSASRSTTPVGIDMDVVEGRYAELDDYTVSFETFKQDLDVAPYFRGLPADACTCLHLGYVTAGQITFSWPDREETYVEGDAYVAPPGHRPLIAGGTSVVEFSVTADLEPVMTVIARNIEAMARVGSMTTVTGGVATLDDDLARLADRLVRWLETGVRPHDLFADHLFVDLSIPHWRMQTLGSEAAFGIRESEHPYPGSVRVEGLDQTARGFLLQFEERWTAQDQEWYCREMIHCAVDAGRVSELIIYCTGDWDAAVQRRHAEQVHLIRA